VNNSQSTRTFTDSSESYSHGIRNPLTGSRRVVGRIVDGVSRLLARNDSVQGGLTSRKGRKGRKEIEDYGYRFEAPFSVPACASQNRFSLFPLFRL
jgi:hypothetical protein